MPRIVSVAARPAAHRLRDNSTPPPAKPDAAHSSLSWRAPVDTHRTFHEAHLAALFPNRHRVAGRLFCGGHTPTPVAEPKRPARGQHGRRLAGGPAHPGWQHI